MTSIIPVTNIKSRQSNRVGSACSNTTIDKNTVMDMFFFLLSRPGHLIGLPANNYNNKTPVFHLGQKENLRSGWEFEH